MGYVFCWFYGTEMAFLTASQLWSFRKGEVTQSGCECVDQGEGRANWNQTKYATSLDCENAFCQTPERRKTVIFDEVNNALAYSPMGNFWHTI